MGNSEAKSHAAAPSPSLSLSWVPLIFNVMFIELGSRASVVVCHVAGERPVSVGLL
jgi:hypothetical protein